MIKKKCEKSTSQQIFYEDKRYNHTIVICLHCLFILIIVASIGIHLNNLNSIMVLNDEFGYWGIAASFAGYDWTPLLAQTPFYSAGYSWLLAIIMKFGNDPIVWYRIAIVFNILMLIGCYFLSYQMIIILGKIAKNLQCEPWRASLIAGVSVVLPQNIAYGQVAWSETLLVFLIWLATFIIVSNQHVFAFWKITLIIFVLTYGYMVHLRVLPALLFGLVICIIQIFQKMPGKKALVLVLVIILLAIAGIFLVRYINTMNQRMLWSGSEMSAINDVSVDSATNGYLSLLINHPTRLLMSVAGKLDYAILTTNLLLFVPIFQMFYKTYLYYKKGIQFQEFSIYFWIIFLSLGMLLLTSFQMADWRSRQDMAVYGRYFDFVLGPLIAVAWVEMRKRTKSNTNIYALSTGAIVFLATLYPVYRAVKFSNMRFTTICSTVIGGYIEYFKNIKPAFLTIYFVILFFGCIWVIFFLLKRKKSRRVCYICLVVLALAVSLVDGWYASQYVLDVRSDQDTSSKELLNILDDVPEDSELVYVCNTELDPISVIPKYFQYYIPELTIDVLFSDDTDSIDSRNHASDSNENIYYLIKKGDTKNQTLLEKKGYKQINKDNDDLTMNVYH